jgi:hypothetical protein
VPRPSSSNTINERGEAALMISQVSVSSTMNVCETGQYAGRGRPLKATHTATTLYLIRCPEPCPDIVHNSNLRRFTR